MPKELMLQEVRDWCWYCDWYSDNYLLLKYRSHSSNPQTADEVCYDRYGCFSTNPPFDNLLVELPQAPEEIETSFLLFTPESSSQSGEILNPSRLDSFTNSTFNKDRKLKIIIHGFMQSGNTPWVLVMRDELLKREALNVIVVNWEGGSDGMNLYDIAAGNTRLVGAQVAEVLTSLQNVFDYDLAKVHIIGHSLGAHVAGYAGTILKKKIGRITGLDPARPAFDVHHQAVRLDPTDAMFVDVIHTDAGTNFLEGSLGLERPSGHVDFYPNGGDSQPGCTYIRNVGDILAKIRRMNNVPLPWIFACDHMKVISYFIESINRACATLAFPCESWKEYKEGRCFWCKGACARMGYDADQNPRNVTGTFYMTTSEKAPFCAPRHSFSVILSELKSGSDVFNVLVAKKIQIELIGTNGTASTSKPMYLEDVGSVKSGRISLLVSSDKVEHPGQLKRMIIRYSGRSLYVGKITLRGKYRTYTACFKRFMWSFYAYSSYTLPLTTGDSSCT